MEKSVNNTSDSLSSMNIHIKVQNRYLSILPEKILFCKAEGSYTKVFLEGDHSEVLISKSLSRFQRCIQGIVFIRCHHSYLVNVSKIQSFDSKKKIIVILNCTVPVSRRRANSIFISLADLAIPDLNSDLQKFCIN